MSLKQRDLDEKGTSVYRG